MTDSPVPSGSARPARALDIISVAFVALLLISNIAATKAFMVGSSTHYLIFDGGAILFPLTYIIGDVLSEVYGFARARRVIVMGFVASFLASLTFFIVQYLPPAPDYETRRLRGGPGRRMACGCRVARGYVALGRTSLQLLRARVDPSPLGYQALVGAPDRLDDRR